MKRFVTMMMVMVMMFGCTGCAEEETNVKSYQTTIWVDYMDGRDDCYVSSANVWSQEENGVFHKWEWDYAYSIVERANEWCMENDPHVDYYVDIKVPDETTRRRMESVTHSMHVNIEIK